MGKLDDAINSLNKEYGPGAVLKMGEAPEMNIEVIPTGAIALDRALGVGGLPRGRVIEVVGPECLDADTFVQFETRTKEGRRQNHKGGTIEDLWYKFNNQKPASHRKRLDKRTKDSEYYLASVNEDGRIIQNKIIDVMESGEKECFTIITTSGKSITASAKHKFLSNGKYVNLSSLKIGDSVMVHENVPFTNGGKERDRFNRVHREEIFLAPLHPYASKKQVDIYTYSRVRTSRALVEANQSGMSLDEYKNAFKKGDVSNIKFLSHDYHVHHLNENPTDNRLINLEVVSASDHGKLHAKERHNNLRYTVIPDVIKSIKSVGLRKTYDIEMQAPYNNFVANKFVVHNSAGKSTLALHLVKEAQKMGGTCVYVDTEHALDPVYAAAIGVNIDDLLIAQPSTGEEALEIVDAFAKTGEVMLIVVDSVAALTPRAEIEGQMGDTHMGLLARLMSQAMRKLTGTLSKTDTTVLFINQIREKIGVMFGSNETSPGGRALRFYSSVRLDIRRIESIKQGVEVVGNRTRVKVIKNKCAPPFKQAEFDIMYGVGISQEGSLLDVAVTEGVVRKSGAWFYFGEESLGQGRENAKQALIDDPDIFSRIEVALAEVE